MNVSWGISIYDILTMNRLIRDGYYANIVQYPYNVLHQNDPIGDICADLNIKTHVRSVFLQGLLVQDRIDFLPPKFQQHPDLIAWYEWIKTNKINPIQACLFSENMYKRKKVLGFDHPEHLLVLRNFNHIKLLDIEGDFYADDLSLLDPRKWNTN